jgi:hypothetical protein
MISTALIARLAFITVETVALVARLTFIAQLARRYVGSNTFFQFNYFQFDFLHDCHLLPRIEFLHKV